MIIYINNYDVGRGFAYTHNHATTTLNCNCAKLAIFEDF